MRTPIKDAILDGFAANDGVSVFLGIRGIVLTGMEKAAFLTADQMMKLDPIVTQVRLSPTLEVEVGGFADATEQDPPDGVRPVRVGVGVHLAAQIALSRGRRRVYPTQRTHADELSIWEMFVKRRCSHVCSSR